MEEKLGGNNFIRKDKIEECSLIYPYDTIPSARSDYVH